MLPQLKSKVNAMKLKYTQYRYSEMFVEMAQIPTLLRLNLFEAANFPNGNLFGFNTHFDD